MPQSTGKARPPDGHGRGASDDQPTGTDSRGAANDDNLTSLGDETSLGDLDRTVLPGPPKPHAPPDEAEDATRFEPAPSAGRPPTDRRMAASAPATAATDHRQATGGATGDAASDEGPLAVGQSFGPRYSITRVLGVGGMGAVYQAWDAELGVDVAVKVIRPEIAADPIAAGEIERRFKRELLLARQVTHPNIIRIHDLGDIGGIKYITMPFIDGSDLATVLKREKKLRVPRALRIARGTVSGLVSAHEAGVIHRDLKPANIMIGWDDAPTIMDFGIARSAGGAGQGPTPSAVTLRPSDLSRTAAMAASSTMAGAIVGTVAYMAPEQARGEEVDQRADIYAFGLIAYDMIVGGRRSERAPSAIAELQQRMQTAPPPPRSIDPSIPEAVDAIIRRCLEPDPAKRFQTTVELQNAVDRLDENGNPLPIMRRVSRRTLIAAAIMVVALLGSTYYVTRLLTAPPVEHAPVTMVIADLQNNTGDPTFDRTLEPMLTRALEGAGFISAYDRNRIRAGLGVAAPDTFDEIAARELAVKQGIAVVLAGSVDTRGGGYEISVKAAESVTGKVITTARRRASNKDAVLATATELMATVRRALGDSASDSSQMFAMRSVSAGSLEVVAHYAAAVQAQSNNRFDQALDSYAKAVALDPTFGLGYQGLAAMSRNLGRTEDAEKYIKEALRHLDGMTDRERFGTRAFYYRMIGDNQQCAKEYSALLDLYPADTVGHIQRASCLFQLKQMQEAVNSARQAVAMLPNHMGYRTNLALLTAFAGDFEAVEAEVNQIAPPSATALLALAYSQMARGLPDATATYEKMATMGPTGASLSAAGLADVALYQGRFSDAIPILEQGAAADLATKSVVRAAVKQTSIAYAHLMRGANAPAIAAADRALETSNAMAVRFLAGRVFAQAGALDKAEKIAATLIAELPASPQAHGKIILGEIALAKGDAREAIRILTEATTLLDTWLGRFALGRAYLEAEAFPQADSEFDRCIARRGEALSLMEEGPTFGHFPMTYYYQGRVREALGTAAYADSYREYLKIRGASTEDPLLPEVRRRAGN
ncbi:MAG TPA: protein kinase [Vicinamibacterales bacterium]|nr:protein kinase [Vicinamibacterales bacterium]